jgi:hypothetical protein
LVGRIGERHSFFLLHARQSDKHNLIRESFRFFQKFRHIPAERFQRDPRGIFGSEKARVIYADRKDHNVRRPRRRFRVETLKESARIVVRNAQIVKIDVIGARQKINLQPVGLAAFFKIAGAPRDAVAENTDFHDVLIIHPKEILK